MLVELTDGRIVNTDAIAAIEPAAHLAGPGHWFCYLAGTPGASAIAMSDGDRDRIAQVAKMEMHTLSEIAYPPKYATPAEVDEFCKVAERIGGVDKAEPGSERTVCELRDQVHAGRDLQAEAESIEKRRDAEKIEGKLGVNVGGRVRKTLGAADARQSGP